VLKQASLSAPCVVQFDDISKVANGEPIYITGSGWPSIDDQEWVVQNLDKESRAASLANSDTSKETAAWKPDAAWTLNAFADVCAHAYAINQNPATSIDTTTLCDKEKTFLVGFQDPGTLTFDFYIDPTDPDYLALNEAYKDGEQRMFELIYRNGAVRTLPVIVQSINETGGVDQAVHGAPPYVLTTSIAPVTGTNPLTATLTLTESGGGRATSFAVDWGDGTSVETVPGGTVMHEHVYAVDGTFEGLVTPDLHGVPGSAIPIPSVTVTPPYSVVATVAPLAGVVPLDVVLTLAESNGAATSFDVDWGDTTIETVTAAGGMHNYPIAGSFPVSVTPTLDGSALAPVDAGTVVVS